MSLFLSHSVVRIFNAVILAAVFISLVFFASALGLYNYDRSIKDLKEKSENTVHLASVSLAVPVWNFDDSSIKGTLSAISSDDDVVAFRLISKPRGELIAQEVKEKYSVYSFDELMTDLDFIQVAEPINYEENLIGEIHIITSTQRVKSLIRYTTVLISLFSFVLAFFISIFVFYFGKKILQEPINRLRESAHQLASGNLGYAIDTQRVDELGSLAKSFDSMRNAIKMKLDNLSTLNHTGQVMAGLREQEAALSVALKVIYEQINSDNGFVYRLDDKLDTTCVLHYPKKEIDLIESGEINQIIEQYVDKCAKTREVIFIPNVKKTKNGEILSAYEAMYLLCVPMIDDQKIFGVMAFYGQEGMLHFSDEDSNFALTIARMTVVTINNIKMIEVIEEQNKTLERKVVERTQELRQKTNDISAMLQNMRQGIFTIIDGGSIHPEYSSYLSEIFETKDIENKSVYSFLFDESDVSDDQLAQMKDAIVSSVGESDINFEFNSHVLLDEYVKYFSDGRKKILEIDWNPVLDTNDDIDKIMVTVRDVTELKILRAEMDKQKEQLDIVGQILSASKDKFLSFVHSSRDFLQENKALIDAANEKNVDLTETLFRNMHTIKGNARTYGFSYIVESAHEAESMYEKVRREWDEYWDKGTLLAQLSAVVDAVDRYECVYDEMLSSFVSDSVNQEIIDNITSMIDELGELPSDLALKNSFGRIKQSIGVLKYVSLEALLESVVAAVPNIAKQLGKVSPKIHIGASDLVIDKNIEPKLNDVFMHIFRNSIDHGLEDEKQREAAGKSPQGTISVDITQRGDEVILTYRDDGKGLILDKIKEKALSVGLMKPGDKKDDGDIAEMIFSSGFSTASAVSDISGRGVGMDAVRSFVRDLGGDVHIVLQAQSGNSAGRPFNIVINLPAKHTYSFENS